MTPPMREAVRAIALKSRRSPTRRERQAAAAATRRRRCLSPRIAAAALLCAVTVTTALVSIGRQTAAYQNWWYARQSLPALLTQLKQGGENPRLLYHIGRRLNQQQRFGDADGYLRQGVGLDPHSARLRDEWARALLGSAQTTAAFGQLREFAGTHPNSAAAHHVLGKFYFAQNSMRRARDEFGRAVRLDPNDAEAWAYLSQANAASLETQTEALYAARQAVALRPRNGGDHLLLASLLSQSDSPEAARREYAQAAALTPQIAVVHQKYAEWLLRSPDVTDRDLCVNEARRAVLLDPGDAASQLVLGRALIAQGQSGTALAPLTRASELDREAPAAALALAQVYHRFRQFGPAEQWRQAYLQRQAYVTRRRALQEAVVLSPNKSAPRLRLARFLGLNGKVEDAARHHAIALRCGIDAPPALVATARDLTQGGHADLALPLARRAVEIAKNNPQAHEAFGDALLALGQHQQAIQEYNKTLSDKRERLPALQARLEQFARTHPQLRLAIIQVRNKRAAAPGKIGVAGVRVGARPAQP